jgi:hypothetical protein
LTIVPFAFPLLVFSTQIIRDIRPFVQFAFPLFQLFSSRMSNMKKAHLPLIAIIAFLLAACSSKPRSTVTLPPTPESSFSRSPSPSAEAPTTNEIPSPSAEALITNAIPATEVAAQEIVIDDFEKPTTAWKAGTQPNYMDSSAIKVAVSSEYASQGNNSLALTFGNDKSKAIFILEGQFDATKGDTLAFELNNPQGTVAAVAIAVCTGDDWYWHESALLPVQPGANSLAFDLTSSTYKTAAVNWELTTTIANRQDVKRYVVILYPTASGSVYLDNFRLLPAGAAVTFLPTTQPPEFTPGPSPTPAPCPGKAALPASEAPLALSLASTSLPARFELVEFDLQTSYAAQNPYDPAEIDLILNVTAPDGSQFSVPAFWFQDFDPATASPCGQPGWKARLTPDQEGEWKVQAEIAGQDILSQPLKFIAGAKGTPGFVRLHPQNPNYFAFDDGSTFFPVGLNIGWWQSSPLEDYARWMDQLSANGGTLIRVWMADWSFGIEWNDTGLGNYDGRQYRAWLLDQLFQMARARGIYIELVLLNHGAFSDNTNPEWEYNPYNAALGGPLDSPAEFASNETARQYFQRRLRYIAARWGYSTNLFAWEWWNEVNWTPISTDDLAAWVVEMTAFLKHYDPYDHLVSISYAGSGWPQVLDLPEIDFIQHHEYSFLDPLEEFPKLLEWEKGFAPGKPVLFAEFGYSASGEDATSFDQHGIHLHNGLWAATFSGFASPVLYWWWDSYIDPLGLWDQFGSLTTFLKGQDLASLTPVEAGKIKLSAATASALALGSEERLLAWVRNPSYNAYLAQARRDNDVRSKKTPESEWRYQLEPLTGLTLTVMGLQDGSYTAKWYDPSTGQWLTESTVTIEDGNLMLDVPAFSVDVALRIEPVK